MNNITKKVVLVTGGARGIGADICRKLALKGYSVAICYNSSEMEALELKQDLLSLGVDSDIFKADISNPNEVRKMFINIDNRFGSLYALVNNSGIAEQALFTDITDDMWDRMISTNLSGAFYCSREAVKRMLKNKDGKIVNVASMWGEVGAAMEVHYSASKAGLIGLTKALAKELGLSGSNITSISLSPCVVPSTITVPNDYVLVCSKEPQKPGSEDKYYSEMEKLVELLLKYKGFHLILLNNEA